MTRRFDSKRIMALCDRLLPEGWVCGAYGSDECVYVNFIKPLDGKYLLDRLVPISNRDLKETGVDLFAFEDKDADKLVEHVRNQISIIDERDHPRDMIG